MIGLHLIVDGIFKPPLDGGDIEKILSELPSRIDMNVIAGPVVVEGCPENPGWTGFVIIDKSHISIHTFDDGNRISVDVFSCKPFREETALSFLEERIRFEKKNVKMLTRSEE